MRKITKVYLDLFLVGFLIFCLLLIHILKGTHHNWNLSYIIGVMISLVGFMYSYIGSNQKIKTNYILLIIKIFIITIILWYYFLISPKYTDGIAQAFSTLFFGLYFLAAVTFIYIGKKVSDNRSK